MVFVILIILCNVMFETFYGYALLQWMWNSRIHICCMYGEWFLLFGCQIDASGGYEPVETARTRLRWMKFRECGEFLYGKKFSLNMKERVYRTCVRSAMLYGSETWCLRENQTSILRWIERAMVMSNVWHETDGQKEHWWIDEHAGIKRHYGKSGKSKQGVMV